MKHYYTNDPSGTEVEVSPGLAKQLVQAGKKQASDFSVEDDGQDTATTPAATTSPAAPQGTGYNYVKPEDYQDLYANAREVGYSGLDANQKALFDQAYPSSKAAAHGMSLDAVHNVTDQGAVNNPQLQHPSVMDKIGEALRVPLGTIAAAGAGTLAGANAAYEAPWGNKLGAYWDAANLQTEDSMNKAIHGEGIEGMIADPANLLAGGLGKVGEFASKIPLVSKIPIVGKYIPGAVGAAAEGAVQGTASNLLNPSEQLTYETPLISGLVGGGLSTGGQIAKDVGVQFMPNRGGYATYLNRHGQGEDAVNQNIANLYDQTSFPITQSKLQATNEANRVAAAEGMNQALDTRLGDQPVPTPDAFNGAGAVFNQPQPAETFVAPQTGVSPRLYNNMGEQSAAAYPHANGGQQGWFSDNEWENLRQAAHKQYEQNTINNPTAPPLAEVKKAIDARIDDIKAKAQLRPAAVPEGSVVVGKIDPATGTIQTVPLPAVRSVQDVSRQKHVVTSQFRPTNNPERVGMEADDVVHEAINQRLNQIPGYKEAAAPYSKQYAIAKGLGKSIELKPDVPTGWARWAPHIFNTYSGAPNIYKLGSALTSGTPNRLISGIVGNLGTNPEEQ